MLLVRHNLSSDTTVVNLDYLTELDLRDEACSSATVIPPHRPWEIGITALSILRPRCSHGRQTGQLAQISLAVTSALRSAGLSGKKRCPCPIQAACSVQFSDISPCPLSHRILSHDKMIPARW